MLKIGIIGDDTQGRTLSEIINNYTTCTYSGSYYSNPEPAGTLPGHFNLPVFTSYPSFLSACDVILVESVAGIDPGYIIEALKESKHILLEKPVDWQDEELEYLFKLAEEANTLLQLREPLLFDPVLLAAEPFIHTPAFIDYQIGISSGVPVGELPELIQRSLSGCLDAIFHLHRGRVTKHDTVFSPDLFGFPGVIHGRIEFDDGSIANITCNGYAEQNKSVCNIYQENRHAILNFLNRRLVIKDRKEEMEKPKTFSVPLKSSNPLAEEILSFTGTILNKAYHLAAPERSLQSFLLSRRMIENLPIREVQV